MKNLPLIFLLLLVCFGAFASESPDVRSLFNGTNLSGWTPMGGGKFYVTNGVIRAEGGKGWLRTDRAFTNFIFEVEWRGLETNFNSGIFVRAASDGDPWETNVWQVNTKQSAIGELLEGSKKITPADRAKISPGEWVRFRIEANGKELSLDVNGNRTWKITAFTPTSGFIGLQAEGKSFEFREVKIRTLP